MSEKFGKEMGLSDKTDAEIDAKENTEFSDDIYNLDCTNCGGFDVTITEQEINDKTTEINSKLNEIVPEDERDDIIDSASDGNGHLKMCTDNAEDQEDEIIDNQNDLIERTFTESRQTAQTY